MYKEDHQNDNNTTKEPKQDVWVAARPILNGKPVTLPQFVVASEQKMGNPLTSFTTFDVNSSEYTPNSFQHNAVTTNDSVFPQNHVPGAIAGPYAIGFNIDGTGAFVGTDANGTCRIKFTLDLTGGPPTANGDKLTLSIEAMGSKLTMIPSHKRPNLTGRGPRPVHGPARRRPLERNFFGNGGKFPSLQLPEDSADKRKIDLVFNGRPGTSSSSVATHRLVRGELSAEAFFGTGTPRASPRDGASVRLEPPPLWLASTERSRTRRAAKLEAGLPRAPFSAQCPSLR
jgi:hypothetical protein